MKIIASSGHPDIATVYMADMGEEKYVEFVQSVQPPVPKREKWVLIVSTLFGCPVGCKICDAGGYFKGKMTKEQIMNQIDFLVDRDFPNRKVTVDKFKVQFARMGEPAMNPAVLDVLEELPSRFDAPGLMPSVSTIAPAGCDDFFRRLLEIKNRLYGNGRFQMQFSIHSTNPAQRDQWIPVKKWDFSAIAAYGERFVSAGDRKVTLNFALSTESEVNTDTLLRYFDPALFLIKLTPVNPTVSVTESNISSAITEGRERGDGEVIDRLRRSGYEVLVSVGEWEENRIGSNCGQFIKTFQQSQCSMEDSYIYQPREN
jgi:23S rRNA (adenine2503-C2)-methyltransferase